MDAGKTGAYLAALRKARGMTQQEAADQLGVSNKTVSKWENGAGLPDITVLPALAELYGVTADDILAGETLRGRPAEAQGPARRRLLLLRLRTRFDLCFIGSLALGVLAAFRVAYVSLAAWPLSVGLLWIGYVLAVHPARYGDISLDAKIWENLYRKLLAASAVQWWALLRLVRLGTLEVGIAGHHGLQVGLCLLEQHLLQVQDHADDDGDLLFHIEAEVYGHLVVPAAGGVQALARVADTVGEHDFNIHVDVLVVVRELHAAGVDVGQDGLQTVDDLFRVTLLDDALLAQHGGVGDGAGDVLPVHPRVKRDGGIEVVD